MLYDIATDSWTSISSSNYPRSEHTAVSGGYVLGGRLDNGACTPACLERYELLTDSWSVLAAPPVPAWTYIGRPLPNIWHPSSTSLDGFLYVCTDDGSGDATKVAVTIAGMCWKYDMTHDEWAIIASPPAGYGGPSGAMTTVAPYVYLLGGQETYNWRAGKTTVARYDPVSDSWSKVSEMAIGRHALGAVAIDQCIYVLGTSVSPPYGSMERYNTTTDSWSRLGDPPFTTADVATDGVYIYQLQSVGHSPSMLYMQRYDPASATWSVLSSTTYSWGSYGFSAVWSCTPGYVVIQDSCTLKTCTCDNGNGASGTSCPTHGSEKC